MCKKKEKEVWIIDRDWKGFFSPKKVLKSEADNVNIQQFETEAKCRKAISTIFIDEGYQ